MSTEERQALFNVNTTLAIHDQHYGCLEALERDYSLLMTQEQWNLLNALPDKAELEAREAQRVSFLVASNLVQARQQTECLGRRNYLADGSDQGKKRKHTVEIFHNQTTSLSEFPSCTIDVIKNLTTDKSFVKPSVIPTHTNKKKNLKQDTEGWLSLQQKPIQKQDFQFLEA